MKKIILVIQVSVVDIAWENRLFEKFNTGKGALDTLLERLISTNLFRIVVATSEMEEDRVFEDIAKRYGIECIRGEQRDIVQRLLKVANTIGCDDFIRVSAYSPLIDIAKLKELYDEHVSGKYDYSFNEHYHGVPMGMGGDVFSTSVLVRLEEMCLDISQKEFVGIFIRQNDSTFAVRRASYEESKGGRSKLTIETKKDFEVVNELLDRVEVIDVEHISTYLEEHRVLRYYNRENPPQEVGVEKLLLNENKVQSILTEGNPDLSYPVSVELTLTNACNLKCIYCSDLELRKKQGAEFVDPQVFYSLFDDLAKGGTKGVVLEGGGEPTMYRYFPDIVKYARKVGLAVGLITNGTKHLDAEIVKSLEWVRVSLDASNSEEYIKLKGVDCFEQVLSNISNYTKNCSTVGVGYVVTNQNISQLESLVLRLRLVGASYVQLRPVVDNPTLYPEGIDLNYLKYYQTERFGVDIGGMTENAEGGNNHLPCYANSITSVISGDGSVFLCGRLNIYDWLKPIGNIHNTSFREIWFGEERKKQTEMVLNADFCKKNCPQCRVSKFNSVFDRLYNVRTKHFI